MYLESWIESRACLVTDESGSIHSMIVDHLCDLTQFRDHIFDAISFDDPIRIPKQEPAIQFGVVYHDLIDPTRR